MSQKGTLSSFKKDRKEMNLQLVAFNGCLIFGSVFVEMLTIV